MSEENNNEENQNEESNNPENQNEENQNEENQNEETNNDEGHDHESHDHENDSTADTGDDAAKNVEDQTKETVSEIKEGWNEATKSGENKKLLAGILGIVVGGLGVHKFILGYNKEGIIMLVVGVVGWFLCAIPTGIVCLIGLIEGIIYLTKSDEEFYETYQVNKKPWF